MVVRTMANTQNYITSAINGGRRLSEALERINSGGCEKCGHLQTIDAKSARELDKLIWEALRYAEGRQR